jgi:hypothetical protein
MLVNKALVHWKMFIVIICNYILVANYKKNKPHPNPVSVRSAGHPVPQPYSIAFGD